MRAKNFLIATAMAVGLLAATRAEAQVLLSDNFEYADDGAFGTSGTGWTRSHLTNFALNQAGFDPSPTALATIAYNGTTTNTLTGVSKLGRFASAAYGTRALSTAVTADTGWSIKFDLLFETYSRNAGVGLLNAATGAGYTVQWNGSGPQQSTGRGVVTMHQRNASALAAQSYGTTTVGNGEQFANGRRPSYPNNPATYGQFPSGSPPSFSFANNGNGYHPVAGYRIDATDGTNNVNNQTYSSTYSGFAQFELIYTPDYDRLGSGGVPESGARLALYVTGPANPDSSTPIFDVVDLTPYIDTFSFDMLYVTGANANFDNIVVTAIPVPEPASIAAISGVGLLLLQRRRRGGAR